MISVKLKPPGGGTSTPDDRRVESITVDHDDATRAVGNAVENCLEVAATTLDVNNLYNSERKQLVDQHQVISIIATAVYECFQRTSGPKTRYRGSQANS